MGKEYGSAAFERIYGWTTNLRCSAHRLYDALSLMHKNKPKKSQ